MSTRPLLALAGVLLALSAVACSAPAAPAVQAPATTPNSPPVASAPTALPGPGVPPIEVYIPAIEARSNLIPTGIAPDGTAEVPPVDQPLQASWLEPGWEPGEVGPAAIYGHVNGAGQPGIFARLGELKPGDEVKVTRADGQVLTFEVTAVEQYAKDAFPTDKVYGATDGPELRLVTCGGAFDGATGHYTDNLVAYAELV